MSDKLNKPDRLKTHAEILKETSEILKQHEFPANSEHPVLERFTKFGEVYTRLNQENEARKSAEQRAKEQAENTLRWARERENKAQAKTEKERLRLKALFSQWCKRDTWLLHDEAIPLVKGYEPTTASLLVGFDNKSLGELAQSCAGHSLKVVNLNERQNLWRVEPREWARWLTEKGQAVPQELIDILLPKPNNAEPEKKTTRATQTRERKKRDKIVALKKFLADAGERARNAGLDWDEQAIPVTKDEFLEVFCRQYPKTEQIGADSFDRYIKEIGIKFKHGVKHKLNNMLFQLFKTAKTPKSFS
ncbi:hypothetical protein [Nitrosovibrio tenuis]|uniref:Uncharacterized protein n=1 Tax=Nitrosovibrio tenuis TaxID=1233 RepID=A0A1H7R9V2_9PROT|nr:hypothetical protein [Nitrosovibrio tenuis]SEL56963.1 hypothetical protein SAMN05216387_1162 [Nitrosovibrio tenuis]